LFVAATAAVPVITGAFHCKIVESFILKKSPFRLPCKYLPQRNVNSFAAVSQAVIVKIKIL
jgi:hypothetical protein